MSSELQDTAARYADDCARTLFKHYQVDNEDGSDPEWKRRHALTWELHRDARDRFERTFPRLEWQDFAEPALLKAIERAHP